MLPIWEEEGGEELSIVLFLFYQGGAGAKAWSRTVGGRGARGLVEAKGSKREAGAKAGRELKKV